MSHPHIFIFPKNTGPHTRHPFPENCLPCSRRILLPSKCPTCFSPIVPPAPIPISTSGRHPVLFPTMFPKNAGPRPRNFSGQRFYSYPFFTPNDTRPRKIPLLSGPLDPPVFPGRVPTPGRHAPSPGCLGFSDQPPRPRTTRFYAPLIIKATSFQVFFYIDLYTKRLFRKSRFMPHHVSPKRWPIVRNFSGQRFVFMSPFTPTFSRAVGTLLGRKTRL